MKKILVLVESYPDDFKKSLMYVHTRNICYCESGFKVKVLNFSATKNYSIDNIDVISYESFKNSIDLFEDYTLVLHAPNLKHHYTFLKKYGRKFRKLVFFFHGHEVLKVNKTYSKPYKFVKENIFKIIFRNIYDDFKLFLWRKFFHKNIKKCYLVFVSNWMYDEFVKWVKIDEKLIANNYEITYNGIGHDFEDNKYNKNAKKEFDFITIRANLDWSKYAVDIVAKLAKNNPKHKFLLIGKGNFFKYFDKPNNLIWINETLNHHQIIDYLNRSKCALMPTRTDAQGLMMCEMASFGIPLITSSIPVCKEVFEGFSNVEYLDNDHIELNNLSDLYHRIENYDTINEKYYCKNTTKKEINFLKKI